MSILDKASLIQIPSGYKEDKLYSIIPSDGSGDLTFSRASTATRVNAEGLIETSPVNLLQQSNSFDTTWTKANIILTSGQADKDGGTDAWKFQSNSAGTTEILQSGLSASLLKTHSVYAKAGNVSTLKIYAGGLKEFNLSAGTTSSSNSTITSVGGGWYRCEVFDTTQNFANIYITASASGEYIYIQDAQVNAGSTAKPYFPTIDRLNVPRLDYSGGASCASLLLEKQSTNLFTYSEQLQTGTGGTIVVTPNTSTSPDGTQNADSLGAGYLTKSISQSAGTWTFSTFAKYLSSNTFDLYIYDGAYYTSTFNVSTGVVTSTTAGVTASIQNMGNGWYRCIMTATTVNNVSEIGFGSGNVYAWGAQVEAGSYPTSYIPTAGATATRIADVCNGAGDANTFNDSEGVLYIEAKIKTDSNSSINSIGISNGTDANRLSIIMYGNSDLIRANMNVGGASQFDFLQYGNNPNQYYKIAVAYKQNNCRMFINGVKVNIDTSATMPSSGTFDRVNLDIGNGLYDFYGKTKQLMVFNEALSDEELSDLTGQVNLSFNNLATFYNYTIL